MTNYIERILDVSSGETTEREYSDKEIAEIQANIAQLAAIDEIEKIKAFEKAALLAKLGITEDEAKLLLS